MSYDFSKLSASLSTLIDENEKILIPFLSNKLEKAAAEYPEDATIGMMASVVEKMSDNKKLFLTRAELKDMYKKLYSRNTKFASVFQEELGEQIQEEKPRYSSVPSGEVDFNVGLDMQLAAELRNAFDQTEVPYTDTLAKKAADVCFAELRGLQPNVRAVNGNGKCVVCLASFKTSRGQTSVYIPVKVISAEKVGLPSIFVGNDGVSDLNLDNVENYLDKNAGKELDFDDTLVLKLTDNVENLNQISSVDMALTKLNFSQSQAKPDYQKVLEAVKVKDLDDKEILTFAQLFESPAGMAEQKFGREVVKNAKNVLFGKLQTFGYVADVKIVDSDKDQLIFGVILGHNQASFKVPVKIANGKVFEPSLMITADGNFDSLNKAAIDELIKKQSVDQRLAAVVSPLYEIKASELVEVVRNAVAEQNYTKAEDALNVLAQGEDTKAYQVAFSEYNHGLMENKEVKVKHSCKKPISIENSIHPVCAHLNLPLNKVYQDENGDCRPLYRKAQDDSFESAALINYKVFF